MHTKPPIIDHMDKNEKSELEEHMQESAHEITHEHKGIHGPAKVIIGLFLTLLMILFIVPIYSVRLDPEPQPMPIPVIVIGNIPEPLPRIQDVTTLEVSQTVRLTSLKLTAGCKDSQVCNAKALFYYVRDNIRYISDPPYEYIQQPEETLIGAGDCEDKAILLLMLMKSIGIRSRIVIIPGHAYTQIYMPESSARYHDKEGWINLDTTCSECGFGELPPTSAKESRIFIE